MSIADKLTTISENVAKVYEAGKAAGGDSYYDTFWDAFQDNGKRTGYGNAFSGAYWNNANFKPKHSIAFSSHGIGSTFESCGYEGDLVALCNQQGITLDFSEGVEFSRTFYGTNFTRIGTIDARKATRFYYVFCYSRVLKTIDKIIVAETTPMGYPFQGLSALEEIRFEGVIGQSGLNLNESPLLSHESIMSILAALKDYAGSGATYTLTLGATNLGKLTDAEKLIATQKGWTLA